MAEWLGRGLQNLSHRFDSGRRLQFSCPNLTNLQIIARMRGVSQNSGRFSFSPAFSAGSMENRIQAGFLPARVLPLRNEKLSAYTQQTLVLPRNVWFTPEAVILDALISLAKLFFLWKNILKAAPGIAFRAAVLMLLIFLAIGAKNQPNTVVAGSLSVPIDKPVDLKISAKITAGKAPKLVWPVPKTYISSSFSYNHQGIDLPTAYGTPVGSFTTGKVVFAGWDGGFGKAVVIRHENGLTSRYAHLSSINVGQGEKVYVGNIVGRVGTTGVTTGSHLHFEIHTQNGGVNPLNVLP